MLGENSCSLLKKSSPINERGFTYIIAQRGKWTGFLEISFGPYLKMDYFENCFKIEK
jgi:hypothetical protein